MTETPTSKRPLVTFALFAYNQENYILEAIEGAFAQNYEPLEIILSDDCSSDRTFEIIEEMVAKYDGPHQVSCRRTRKNHGLLLHFKEVLETARGEILVVGAGDDISLPERTEKIVQAMEIVGANLAASSFTRIDQTGAIIEEAVENDYTTNEIWNLVNAPNDWFVNGATAAYRASFARAAIHAGRNSVQSGSLNNEDIFFSAYSIATENYPLEYTDDPLIRYRMNPNSLSNFTRDRRTISDELRIIQRERFRSKTRKAVLTAILEIASNEERLHARLKIDNISARLCQCEIEEAAYQDGFFARLLSVTKVKKLSDLQIIIPRLFGLRALATARHLRNVVAMASART